MKAGTRDAGDGDEAAPSVVAVGTRWAVLVGVSRYQDSRLDLKYARRDAEELHALLRTPEGGDFHEANIRLLVDEDATTTALTRALRGFLIDVRPEDLVLLYFACHGGPDPRRPGEPLYLYTHDTDSADVAGTAVPMDEIDRSMKALIRAERAVIIVDTCHSGGIAGGLRAAGGAETTKRYLDAMTRSRGGIALLTSAEASESSEEDPRWGGGHGVFTHFLLEGMRGAADGYQGSRDGIVAVGELFEYVRDQVEKATAGRQHPAIGSAPFDRGLPMAITADLDVEQHLLLAHGLTEVGWQLDDPAPFLLAARQYAIAADLKRRLPVADADRGAALLAAGLAEEAARVLRVAVASAPDQLTAPAWLALGVAEAESGQPERAAESLETFVGREPGGPETAWAQSYAQWLRGNHRPRRTHALIVGVGEFDGTLSPLPGVRNDIVHMIRSVRRGFGVAVGDLTVLRDAQADVASVLAAITKLAGQVGPQDGVVVYFSGHSNDNAALDEPFLITSVEGGKPDGLSARLLVDSLTGLSGGVLLILDTHVSPAFVQYARQAASDRLTLLLACGIGEVAYELSFHGLMQGAFTHALAEVITRTEITSGGALIDEVRREMADGPVSDRPQTAQLIGSRSQPLLAGSFPAADLWRQARRRTVPPDEIPQLRRVADPLARWTIGRSLLAHGDLVMGRVELEAALNGLPNPPASLLIDLAIAALDLDDPDAAVKALRRAGSAALVTAALAALAAPTLPPAVLVIVTDPEQFPAETITGLLRTVPLLATADTIVVAGRDAIRDRVLSEASACAQQTSQRLAVCVVLGTFSEYGPTQVLHVADGLLRMTDLAAALQTPTPEDAGNLVVLLDRLTSLTSVARDLAVVHAVPEVVLPGTIVKVDEISPDRAALRSLVASGDFPTELAASATAGQGRRVLRDRTAMITARRILVAARHAAAAAAVVRATSEIARRKVRHDSYPEGYLQRGLALEQCGREAEALADLRVARNLYEDDDVWQVEVHRDRSAEEWRRQARYHFGRAQLRYGDDLAEAVGALRAAERQDPGNPRVLRTLALAIRALIEQDVLVEGSGYLARYLNAGAPQGAEPELLDFYLRQRNR